LPDLQPVFPITAAGPPRIFTVFRDTEAMIMTNGFSYRIASI